MSTFKPKSIYFFDFPASNPQPPLPIRNPKEYQNPLLLVAKTLIFSLNNIPTKPKGAIMPCQMPPKNPYVSSEIQASIFSFCAQQQIKINANKIMPSALNKFLIFYKLSFLTYFIKNKFHNFSNQFT